VSNIVCDSVVANVRRTLLRTNCCAKFRFMKRQQQQVNLCMRLKRAADA